MKGESFWKIFDHFAIRIKDLIIIGGVVATVMFWITNFAGLPKRIEASESDVKQINSWREQQNLSMQSVQKDVSAMQKQIEKIDYNVQKLVDRQFDRHG